MLEERAEKFASELWREKGIRQKLAFENCTSKMLWQKENHFLFKFDSLDIFYAV